MDAFSGSGTTQDKPACFKQEAAPELKMYFPWTRAVPHLFSSDIFPVSESETAQSLPSSPDSQRRVSRVYCGSIDVKWLCGSLKASSTDL